MELHGELAKGRFQFLLVAPPCDAKRFVEVNLHGVSAVLIAAGGPSGTLRAGYSAPI
jgi:hypothetical protein